MPPTKRRRRNQQQRRKAKRLRMQNASQQSNGSTLEEGSLEAKEQSESQDSTLAEESMNGEETLIEEDDDDSIIDESPEESCKSEKDSAVEVKKEPAEDSKKKDIEEVSTDQPAIKKEPKDEMTSIEETEDANKESPMASKIKDELAEEEKDQPLDELLEQEEMAILDQDFEVVEEDASKDKEDQEEEENYETPPDIKTLVNKDTSSNNVIKTKNCAQIIRIKNLPPLLSRKALEQDLLYSFKPESSILNITMEEIKNSTQATVEFRKQADSFAAQTKLHRMKYKDRKLVVGFEQPQQGLLVPQPNHINHFHPRATNVVFIANLCRKKNLSVALQSYFKRFGEVKSVEPVIKCSRPYAFIHMFTVEAAVKAIQAIITECEGMPVRLGYGQLTKNREVLVSNIPPALDRRKLRDLFYQCGDVGCLILDRNTAQAVIVFSTFSQAHNAVVMMRGREFHGQRIMVEITTNNTIEKFVKLVSKVHSIEDFDLENKQTLEIKDKSNIETSDKPPKSPSQSKSDEIGQLVEIVGLGRFHIKSTYP